MHSWVTGDINSTAITAMDATAKQSSSQRRTEAEITTMEKFKRIPNPEKKNSLTEKNLFKKLKLQPSIKSNRK